MVLLISPEFGNRNIHHRSENFAYRHKTGMVTLKYLVSKPGGEMIREIWHYLTWSEGG
jgi:hypothetical protein